jgi:AmiR/NasT family two-component response regulator
VAPDASTHETKSRSRQDQFRSALASRDTIGQAKGVIMERFNLDAVEAFELLTRLSQRSNTKLIDIASALIDSEHPLKSRHPRSAGIAAGQRSGTGAGRPSPISRSPRS